MANRGHASSRMTRDDSKASSDPVRYTVGWICAVGVEYVAAQEFLDEEHPQLAEQDQNDDNIYTLGCIGSHNVVIACLPHGSYGTVSAAVVARDVLRTFPNIKFGLMVGIGGGAPSNKQDIRLGDVVVSTVARDNGAVLQYDFGKTIQDQAFKATGFLDAPPRLLTAAVQDLKARYERRGNGLVDSVNEVLASNRRLKKKYSRPPQTCDRLFQSQFTHAAPDEPCDLQCATNGEQLIVRPDRDEDEDDITTVHYGLIASGNALIKDAIMRDRLAEEKGVLCFEMEAAGLMNHFKCLVIRGICDYADTHKNDDWQGYAAMVAAAYARDLLGRIPPSKVDAEKSLKLTEIASDTRELKILATEIHAQISDKASRDQIKLARDWLSPPDPSIDFNKALRLRHRGSGQWFLDSQLYQSWKSRAGSFLWLHARPGCGKTVLSSTVIEHLQERGKEAVIVLYFLFTFNDVSKQSAEGMLRSLTFQLYIGVPESRSVLEEAMSVQQPSFALLCDVFAKMIREAGPVAIVLDALDECSRKEDAVLDALSWVRSFRTWSADVRVLVTSRDEEHIRSSLTAWVREEDILELRSRLVRSDIRHYVHDAVQAHDGLKRWHSRPDVQNEIERTLVDKADGMFRWVSCQLEVLRTCRTLSALRARLQKLPPTLEATYVRILENIPEEDLASSIRILQLLTYIDSPIDAKALVDAMAVNLDEEPFFREENRLPDLAELYAYCPGLISITNFGRRGTVPVAQLAHFSVREWLLTARHEAGVCAQLDEFHSREAISLISMAYLTYCASYQDLDDDDDSVRWWPSIRPPFENVARAAWVENTRCIATRSQAVREMATAFCRNEGPFPSSETSSGIGSHPGDVVSYGFKFPNNDVLALAWGLLSACYYGLTFAVSDIIDAGANPAGHPECPCAPLRAAAQQGHMEVMSLLLNECAVDVEATCANCNHNTPLIAASGSNQATVAAVKMLLDAGARVNHHCPGDASHTALAAATRSGSLGKVRLLVDAGADVNAYGRGVTALTLACLDLNDSIAEYLIEQGALIDPKKDGQGSTITAACRTGKWEVVWKMLQRCADAQSEVVRSRFGQVLWQMLQVPSCDIEEVDLELAAYLVENGADFGAYNRASREPKTTVLQLVFSRFPSNQIIRWCEILLRGGADVNGSLAPKTMTPLEKACRRGLTEAAKLLLEGGAMVDRVPPPGDDGFESALELALRRANYNWEDEGNDTSPWEMVELLLAYGADVNGAFVRPRLGRGSPKSEFESESEPGSDSEYDGWADDCEVTPLMFACHWCLPGVAALLLEHGADPNPMNTSVSPLQIACQREDPSVEDVEALLDAGAEVITGDRTKLATPLQLIAAESGHLEVAALLLANGANVNAISSDDEYASAAYAAAFCQDVNLAELLLANGADASEAELGALAAMADQDVLLAGIISDSKDSVDNSYDNSYDDSYADSYDDSDDQSIWGGQEEAVGI
ncbi:ankyrin repeats (3 copies) domain-containing protein [Sarocladium implicatum]|nr:ankyrin repeats (3 copies) domain-containing protein [Sarocladium implicatum]